MTNGRNIMSSITFSGNEERVLLVFGVRLHKGLQEVIGIFSHHFLVLVCFFTVAKSDSS